MPVGERAIAKAVEKTQHRPRRQGEADDEQVCPAGALPYPARQVEQDEEEVEEEEEIVEEVVHSESFMQDNRNFLNDSSVTFAQNRQNAHRGQSTVSHPPSTIII